MEDLEDAAASFSNLELAPAVPPVLPARRRRWPWFIAAGVMLLAALGWLGGSQSGLRALCAVAAQLTAGRLQIESPGGRLLGDWSAQSVRWQDDTQDVEVRQLSVRWAPRALLHGQIAIDRIEAASMRIFSAASSAPAKLPASLQWPFASRITHLALGRVLLGQPDENPLTLAEGIELALDSDGRTHRLERLQAQLGQLTIEAAATLAGEAPFALQTQAVLTGAALDQPFKLSLLGSGSLDQLQIDGKALVLVSESRKSTTLETAGAAGPSGEIHALITPFAARPLANLSLQLSGLDPSLIVAGAPQALLEIDALLERAPGASGDSAASGHLSISNRRSGTLDRQLLPLESLQAQLKWRGDRLDFEALNVALPDGGRLKGQGYFASGWLELDLAAQNINARALHTRLLPTRLAGPLRARLGGDTQTEQTAQTLELDLRDALYALSARASLTAEAVELASLQLAAGDAHLSAAGRLALNGEGRFTAQGSLQNFDPARFLQPKKGVVRSVINAGFEARGALRPAFELGLHFALRDSRIGAQKLAGKGEVDLLGSRLRKIDIDLEAAGNRLTALGAFGQAGDSVRLKVLAPKLEALGWPGVGGDASANFVLGGSIASPEFSGELQAVRLHLASLFEARGVSLNAQLGAGAQGVLAGLLQCTACSLPASGVPALALEVKAEGVRSRHHLGVRVGLPERRELRLALDGGLSAEVAGKPGSAQPLLWSGTLVELVMGKTDPAGVPPLFQLAAPAPLRVGGAALSFGPAKISGPAGSLSIDRLGLAQGGWQSAGRLQQFRPQAVLAEFPALYERFDALGRANTQPLVLGGEWDFALDKRSAARPAGRAAVWRESGDLLFGTLSLGLAEARLEASLGEGRLAVSGQVHGARSGDLSVEFNAVGASNELSSLIDAQAPWQGRLQARVPDLAWLGPLLGEGWQLAGKANGELRLAGSAARPQLSGEWRGEQLALRALDQGMRLEGGEALVEITPDRLLLRRLTFNSAFQPLPRVLALDPNIDVLRLTGMPGRFEASGELPLGGTSAANTARISFRLDRVGVMQRPEQWVALSGEGELRVGQRALDVGGKLRIDAGFWALAETGRPSLSDDVLIRRPAAERGGGRQAVSSAAVRALRFELEAALGRSFHFRGAGVESRLAGQIRIRSDDAGLPRASGSIRTIDGRFDAYGQKLGIERGIINFQGPIDNPGLNILAVRKNLPVEAGVEVTGTAQRPIIRLVSTPVVPDSEKLSWLVLGHSPDQHGSGDSGLLLAAAQTILGGQDGGVLGKLQQGLGIDEFGVSSGQIGGAGTLPTSRVASSTGFGNSQTVNGQIVSVGKRLSANAMLSYEQSLSTSDSIVKLTVNLSRQFSVVGSAGSESALDFFWNHSFGR